MKKQIAILATMLVASGFSAFGQDWITFSTASIIKEVWDESTTPGVGTIGDTSGLFDVTVLWAATGTADQLPALGTEFGSQNPSAVGNQVATNQVASTASGLSAIASMLASGWSIATNTASGSGSAATGLAETTTSTSGKITAFNSGDAFDLLGGTGASDSSIELIVIAWNASATLGSGTSTFASVADIGWSNPFSDTVGSSAGDGNATSTFNSLNYNSFGVAPAAVPEPTTLALAGLGGLSMLFLRRRKA